MRFPCPGEVTSAIGESQPSARSKTNVDAGAKLAPDLLFLKEDERKG